jgi:GT2 family glycosyltransferase
MTLKNRIGIVIIGRNEGERLVLCLKSVLPLDVPVVYIDSQSIDNSVYNANQYNVPTLILDKSKLINIPRARNEGFNMLLKLAPDLEYIHFIDADCELAGDWLKNAIKALDQDKGVAIVCGRLHEKYRNQSIYMRLCDMDWYTKPGEIEQCGGIFTIRNSVFNQLNGLDETLIAGTDPEFCFRVRKHGWRILSLANDMGTHDSAMLFFSQWWVRSVKCGYAFAHAKDWGGGGKQLKSICFWAAIFPFIILISSIINYYSIVILLAYPLQIFRIYLKSDIHKELSKYDKFLYSFFCVLAKFPSMIGVMRYFYNKKTKKEHEIIEYKRVK